MKEQLLTLEELADFLKLSKMTIYRMVKKKEIPSLKIASQWRFSKKEIESWLLDNKRKDLLEMKQDEKMHSLYTNHPFVQKYKPKFNEFFSQQFRDRFDHVVLVDRKGAKIIETLDIIPSGYKSIIRYPDSFKWIPDHILRKESEGKHVAIIDEIVQYGRNIKVLRDMFENHNATVKTFVLARRRSFFEMGKTKDPYVNACLDLEDTAFMEFTAEMSRFFLTLGKPLDVDHLLLEIKPAGGIQDIEHLMAYFSSLGQIHFLPVPNVENEDNREVILTLDNPKFFEILDNDVPEGIDHEGVCKLRIFIHPKKGCFYLIPVVFPKLKIQPEGFIEKYLKNGTPFSEFCSLKPFKDFSALNTEIQAGYFYRTISLYLSTMLVSSFINCVNTTNVGFQISSNNINIQEEDFFRNYGKEIGDYLYELVKRKIHESTKGANKIILKSKTPENIPYCFSDLDNENICNKVTTLLFEEKMNKESDIERTTTGLSFTEIKENLPSLSISNISKAFDLLLDRGILKPLDEARPTDVEDEYLYLRTYRKGEYDDPIYGNWTEASLAKTNEEFSINKIIRLIPFALERLMQSIPKQKHGVSDILANKIFTNLQHDWDCKNHGPLFLYWKPYYFGPLAGVPKKFGAFGSFYNLKNFGAKYNTYYWDDNSRVFKPNNNNNWRKDLPKYLTPLEEDLFAGLIDVYSSIYTTCNDSSTNILITLSACRNWNLTYIHCYKNLELWKDAFEYFLTMSVLETNNIDLEKYLQNIALPISQIEDKLKRYKELINTKEKLENELKSHPRSGLTRKILESIESPPKINNEITRIENAYLVISTFNSILRQLFSDLGVAKDTRKSQKDITTGALKDIEWYINKLILILDDPLKDETIPLLEKLFQAVKSKTFDEATKTAIKKIYENLKAYYIDDEKCLPKPSMNKRNDDNKYKQFLEAQSQIDSEMAFAYLDIQGYVARAKNICDGIDPEKVEDPPDEENVRVDWSNKTKSIINKIAGTHIYNDQSSPDSWSLFSKDANILLDAICKIMYEACNEKIFLKCVITWGNPNIKEGIPYGNSYIIAFKICEESGMVKGNQIVITENLKDKIEERYLNALSELGDTTLKYMEEEPVKIYKLDWRRFINE